MFALTLYRDENSTKVTSFRESTPMLRKKIGAQSGSNRIADSFKKTLPIVLKSIAHRFGKRCPSFFLQLPMNFFAVAHDFLEPWTTFLQRTKNFSKSAFHP